MEVAKKPWRSRVKLSKNGEGSVYESSVLRYYVFLNRRPVDMPHIQENGQMDEPHERFFFANPFFFDSFLLGTRSPQMVEKRDFRIDSKNDGCCCGLGFTLGILHVTQC